MFLNDDFLLSTPWAKQLFQNHAQNQPIIDYHCHLNPQEIYEDNRFATITEAWLQGDHYKWRLMRADGVPESHITGGASDYDKFFAWAGTLTRAVGNPLYSWTHLELRRFFGINETLSEATAPEIYRRANELLQAPEFSRRSLIASSRVKLLCTTDDPADSLQYHKLLAAEEDRFSVLPTYRPDKYLNIDSPLFGEALQRLCHATEMQITSYSALICALEQRVEYFDRHGCRLSDHALDVMVYREADEQELNAIFQKALTGQTLTQQEVQAYRTETLSRLIPLYNSHNWTMQLHFHAYRNCNTQMFNRLGADTGYDAANDLDLTGALQPLLDRAERQDSLCKTILYSLNPTDLFPMCTLMGCFQQGVAGKMQLGSGWWFVDTCSGMTQQLTTLAENGLLYHFVGMLTDSRSFLSYPRHEYFRRVLCRFVGELVARGEAPEDEAVLGEMIERISYKNAASYFGFQTGVK